MKAIYFPNEKVQILIAESGFDRDALKLNAMMIGHAGKLRVPPGPMLSVLGADPHSFFAEDVKDNVVPADVPKMHGAKYADGSVVSADDLMGEPSQVGDPVPPIGEEVTGPNPLGGLPFNQRLRVRGVLHRYHDMIVTGQVKGSEFKNTVRRFIHSELVAAVVKLSHTPADDAILELLRALVPPPSDPAK